MSPNSLDVPDWRAIYSLSLSNSCCCPQRIEVFIGPSVVKIHTQRTDGNGPIVEPPKSNLNHDLASKLDDTEAELDPKTVSFSEL